MVDERQAERKPQAGDDHPRAHRLAWGWWFFAAVALFYLWSEHRAHLFGVLPYLLLLACPLMHFFMHGHHGRHRGHAPEGGNEERKK